MLANFGTGLLTVAPALGEVRARLVPFHGSDYLPISADGHYRASPAVERELLYVGQTDAGQQLFRPDEFEAKYGWKNDPTKVQPLGKPVPESKPAAPTPIEPGQPIKSRALVRHPAQLPGVQAWTIKTTDMFEHSTWAWSQTPDGNKIAVPNFDGSVRIWDMSSDKVAQILVGQDPITTGTLFSPDGRRLAVHGENSVTVWDWQEGRRLWSTEDRGWGLIGAWSTDGRILALLDGSILLDGETGKQLDRMPLDIGSGGFFPDPATGHEVLAITPRSPGPIAFWDIETRIARPGPSGRFFAASADGRRFATADVDSKSIRVYDMLTQKCLQTLESELPVRLNFSLSPDGNRLATQGAQTNGHIWEVATGKRNDVDRCMPNGVFWTPDSRNVRFVRWLDDFYGLSETDARTGEERMLPVRHQMIKATSLGWSPNGDALVLALERDWAPHVWDLSTGARRVMNDGGWTHSLQWSRSGDQILSCTEGERLVLDPKTGRSLRKFALRGFWSSVGDICAIRAENGDVQIRSGDDDKTLATWTGTAKNAWLAWSPDGQRIAGLGENQKMEVRDVSSGVVVQSLEIPPELVSMAGVFCDWNYRRLAWSSDGRLLAGGLRDRVVIWDCGAGTVRNVLQGSLEYVDALVWHPEGKRLTAVGGNGNVILFDADGEAIAQTRYNLTDVRFIESSSPNGEVLAVGTRYLTQFIKPTGELLATLYYFPDGEAVWISAEGHCRGPRDVLRDRLRFIVQTDDGRQRTLALPEFEQEYGWKNDPEKALLPLRAAACPTE